MNWFPDQTHYSLIFWECAENTKYGDPHYCGHSSHVKFTALQAADTHSKFKEGKLQVNTSHRQTDRQSGYQRDPRKEEAVPERGQIPAGFYQREEDTTSSRGKQQVRHRRSRNTAANISHFKTAAVVEVFRNSDILPDLHSVKL